MKSEPPRKKNFIGVETKFETYQIVSQTQINHPRIINHTNKNFLSNTFEENKKDQNTSIVPNAKDDKEKEEVNIPYSCIPQLEKNDQSYNWENFA